MKAEIISVGTELLLGDIVNTDAAFISKRLAELGISLYRQTVVGDNRERLICEVKSSLERCDVVFITGGLGPTYDDITKDVVAEIFNAPLVMNDDVAREIKTFFDGLGREMSENNLAQAMIPEGATILENRNGTAPGVMLKGTLDGLDGEKCAILLPGPPHELKPMFDESVAPYLESISPYSIFSINLHLFGIGESGAESILRDIMEKSCNPTVAPYAAEAEVRIRVTARASSREECIALCREKIGEIRATEVNDYIFTESTSDDEPAEVLVRRVIELLREKNMTVGTAESCTAGMISSRIADIPGSSDVLAGGIVSYSNDVKMKLLGVSRETLEAHGAVSEECAAEMAKGALSALGCDVAVSVTGIAGPGGGSEEKPVGTVCFGIADKNGVSTEICRFGSMRGRSYVRRRTVSKALMKIIERICEK